MPDALRSRALDQFQSIARRHEFGAHRIALHVTQVQSSRCPSAWMGNAL